MLCACACVSTGLLYGFIMAILNFEDGNQMLNQNIGGLMQGWGAP